MRGKQLGARQRSGRNPVLLFWVLIAAAAMVSTGCGNLSLNSVLSNESPGEFRLSPETVNLQVGGTFTFSAIGGFTPYNYQVVSGLGTVEKDQTWVYQAPSSITGDYIEVTIRATDQLGDSDTATVRVFNPFYIVGETAVTIQLGSKVTIQAAGGVTPYSWAFDDGTINPSGNNPFDYTPTTEGIHVVGISDNIGNYKQVTITVLPPNPPLTIDPVTAGVQVNGTLIFTAFGGTLPYSWSASAGSFTGTGSTVTFNAPADPGTATVTLSDSASPTPASVSATVTVTAAPILPLVLSPGAPTVKAIGDLVQFSATGGVPPYTFSSSPLRPAPGYPEYIDANGLYTQLDDRKQVVVHVKDAAGATTETKVYYAK